MNEAEARNLLNAALTRERPLVEFRQERGIAGGASLTHDEFAAVEWLLVEYVDQAGDLALMRIEREEGQN